MRVLSFVVAASFCLAAVACGLDSNGLEGGDPGGDGDGAVPLTEAGFGADTTLGSVGEEGGSGGETGTGAETAPPPGLDGGGSEGGTGKDAEAGAPTDAGHDAGMDAADAADSCAPVETCNNGIDDNCNGLVDCADPACNAGWACTAAAIPLGWTIAEYIETSRPACSTGYGSPSDVVEGPAGGPATCGCTCTLTPGTCEGGNFSASSNAIGIGGGGNCNTIPVAAPANAGACSPAKVDYSPAGGAKLEATPAPYTAGACAPQASETPPPAVTFAGQGRVCTDTTTSGAGCTNGGVCAPAAAPSGFSLCIVSGASGTQACPPGFTKPHTVGSGVTDGRGCTACTCAGPTATCTGATLTLFPATDCSDGGEAIEANGACNNFPGPTGTGAPGGGGPTYVAYEYTAQVAGEACGAPAVFADGGVTLTGTHTVCCQ